MSGKYLGKRIFYLDELRAIAILCVILCHTTRIFTPFLEDHLKIAAMDFLNVAGLVGVPIFFMLSGALLLNRNYDLGEFFKKRFTRLIYPAIFWIAIAALVGYYFFDMEEAIRIITANERFTWFVYEMIGLYLITPVLNGFVKEYKMKGVKFFVIIWFITIILNTAGHFPLGSLELSYFAGDIGYFMLGYYLVNTDFKMSDLSQCIIGFLLFAGFTVLNFYLRFAKFHINCGYESIFVAMAGLGIFLMFKGLTNYFENKKGETHNRLINGSLGNLIFWISACSYGMYFVNSIIFKAMLKLHLTEVKYFPIIYIGVTLISLAVVYLMSRVSFLKKISGAA